MVTEIRTGKKTARILCRLLPVIFLSGLLSCGYPKQETESEIPLSTAETDLTETGETETAIRATYLGISDPYHTTKEQVLDPSAKIYRFLIDGEEKLFSVRSEKTEEILSYDDGGYPLQNRLHEGETYEIRIEDGEVYEASAIQEENQLPESPVRGTPGEKTLLNLLKTAMMPVGQTLYVYGGGWDFQDAGSSRESETIGLPPEWKKFFDSEDMYYRSWNDVAPEETTYPFNAWNRFFYKGLDCSGYIGWTVYNTVFTDSFSGRGFVTSSTKFAKSLSESGYGEFVRPSGNPAEQLKSGDIVSFPGHVYLVVGKCGDGSIVILHSSPIRSRSGDKGGGVHLAALSGNGGDDVFCEAARLVTTYMEKYYPEWSDRYGTYVGGTDVYLNFPEEKETAGIFHWDPSRNGLRDEEGIGEMSAAEILRIVFDE